VPTPPRAAEPVNAPTAYFITFACYGAHLHGDDKGSIDRFHNVYGSRFVDADPHRRGFELRRMKSPAQFLDHSRRTTVLDAVKQHAAYRGWTLHAVHVRSTHVHIVIQAPLPPEKVLIELKAYASRALNESENTWPRRWAHHGSTRYLWNTDQVETAMDYVVRQQGQPMALYINPSHWLAKAAPRLRCPERK
jgi:REP element-mobilizing transposase RayT